MMIQKFKETVINIKLCVRKNNYEKIKLDSFWMNLVQLKVLINGNLFIKYSYFQI